jgi:hypothetical protein
VPGGAERLKLDANLETLLVKFDDNYFNIGMCTFCHILRIVQLIGFCVIQVYSLKYIKYRNITQDMPSMEKTS